MKQEDRPGFHLTPPRGWLNDPCAPFQDRQGVWHIYYQWVPNHTDWNAEIGWGHATSVDLLTWQADEEPVLMPSETYDCMGVFTGNALTGAGDSDDMTVVYSAINAEARTPGYTQGQERLAVATSTDGGKTFVKSADNPLKVHLPDQLTGFRDPFFAPWPALAQRTGHPPEQIYALVSGGILDRGPTVFLYRVSAGGRGWSFLGPLVEPVPPMPEAWIGDRGWNWECAGFFSLSLTRAAISTPNIGTSEVDERQYLVVGSEGQWNDPFEVEEGPTGRDKVKRPPRWQLWFSGPLISTPEGGVQMDIDSPDGASGVLDWGCLYAVQTIQDRQGRRIMWGWIPDDDLSSEGRARQGWTGSISLPRELYRLVLPNITGALSPLEPKKGVSVSSNAGPGSKTIETLGIRPLAELERGRRRRVDVQSGEKVKSFECSLKISFDPLSTDSIGLSLNLDKGGLAKIIFRPKDERIVVLRPPAPLHPEDEIDTRPMHGRFTLFRTDQGWESLHLRAYFDAPILEVFANDRFALSTHIYTPLPAECSLGLTATPNGSATSAQLDVWEFGPPRSQVREAHP